MIPLTTVFAQFNEQYGCRRFNNAMSASTFISRATREGVNDMLLDEYFFSNLLKKHPSLPLGLDVDQLTMNDFKEAESRSEQYNNLFYQLVAHPKMSSYLQTWQKEVHKIMGSFRPLSRFTVTSGATTTAKRGQTPIERFKFTEATPNLVRNMDLFQCDSLPWDRVTPGTGVLSFVPKTAKIHRAIVIPCAANVFIQRSIGKSLGSCLLKVGINLSSAQDTHRVKARLSSLFNDFTTDDQKWASQLIYTQLVRYLVPADWYHHMNACRDEHVVLPDGSMHVLQQFAGQGNGYCFELETIIFLAMLRTACIHTKGYHDFKDLLVFGDDLIYPKAITETVRAIGRNVGFITNVDKSYSDGMFRESCGGDYYFGMDVRPVYLKGDFLDTHDVTIMCNQLWSLLCKHGFGLKRIYRTHLRLIRHLYKLDRRCRSTWVPDSMEGGLHGRPFVNLTVNVDRANNEFFNVWARKPKQMISFREIAYKADPTYLLRMCTGGLAKGQGYIVIPMQKLKGWQYGPPRPAYAKYPMCIPAPGTAYKTVLVKQTYYQHSPLTRSDNPLDIFKVLGRTSCMDHIYADDYLEAVSSKKVVLRTELLDLLLSLIHI